ncbi:MAG: hypothetical protein ACTHK7_19995 [Aureliella sp.]
MMQLKLKHGYHEAMISAIRYHDRDIAFDVELCSCCNPAPGPATLWFFDVRNFEQVRGVLEGTRRANRSRQYIDEIDGITRGDERGYSVYLMTSGNLEIDARSISEA